MYEFSKAPLASPLSSSHQRLNIDICKPYLGIVFNQKLKNTLCCWLDTYSLSQCISKVFGFINIVQTNFLCQLTCKLLQASFHIGYTKSHSIIGVSNVKHGKYLMGNHRNQLSHNVPNKYWDEIHWNIVGRVKSSYVPTCEIFEN